MSTATLSNAPATQLTFPWAMPRSESAAAIVTDRSTPIERGATRQASSQASIQAALPVSAAVGVNTPEATSLSEAMVGDRIGKPFRVGSVMFRLLKSYGISDEEIADGIAQYTAKKSAFR